jgi:hypothetical protein
VTKSTPSKSARGNVAAGLRTSPAILLTSHHPPKEKKCGDRATGERGRERRGTRVPGHEGHEI